jgi:hypothetical protein
MQYVRRGGDVGSAVLRYCLVERGDGRLVMASCLGLVFFSQTGVRVMISGA